VLRFATPYDLMAASYGYCHQAGASEDWDGGKCSAFARNGCEGPVKVAVVRRTSANARPVTAACVGLRGRRRRPWANARASRSTSWAWGRPGRRGCVNSFRLMALCLNQSFATKIATGSNPNSIIAVLWSLRQAPRPRSSPEPLWRLVQALHVPQPHFKDRPLQGALLSSARD
jgi:hypothetical protein